MKIETMKEEIKTMLEQITNKSAFAAKVAPMLDRSALTIYRHWFFNSAMSPGLPDDKAKLKILRRELKKTIKEQQNG